MANLKKMGIAILLLACTGVMVYAVLGYSQHIDSTVDRIAFIRRGSIRGLVKDIGFIKLGIYVSNVDIDGEVRLTNTGNALAWSPEGDKIAYFDYDTRGLYVIHTDVSSKPKLIQQDIYATDISWSLDGTKIAYDDVLGVIYILNIVTKQIDRLTPNSIQATDPTWSPDGTQIAFTLNPYSTTEIESSIAVISSDGSGLIQLTPDDRSRSPAWSPDGRRIAFGRGGNIFLMNPDGTDTKLLTRGGLPTWSPDGTRIAYISSGENSECDESGYFDQTGFCTNQLRIINIDGSNMIILRDKAEFILSPTWAPKNADRHPSTSPTP